MILAGILPVALAAEPADDLLRTGWEHFRLAEFNLAVKTFEQATTLTKTNPPLRAQALYGLAMTWALRRPGEDPDEAVKLYRQAIAVAPDSESAAWSLLAIARMTHAAAALKDAQDSDEVRRAYQDVIDKFPMRAAGEEAFLFQQAAQLAVPRPETARPAVAALTEFLQTQPRTPYRRAAWSLIAHGDQILGENDQRLVALLQMLSTAEVDEHAPLYHATEYWSIATLAEFDCGNFALAREYYQKLITEYPTDKRIFLAKRELQHMADVEARLRP